MPSLRRLYRKRPYFTNGSARDVADVLRRARVVDEQFLHDGDESGTGTRLATDDQAALLAFLDLL